jgi:hypothetical protein
VDDGDWEADVPVVDDGDWEADVPVVDDGDWEADVPVVDDGDWEAPKLELALGYAVLDGAQPEDTAVVEGTFKELPPRSSSSAEFALSILALHRAVGTGSAHVTGAPTAQLEARQDTPLGYRAEVLKRVMAASWPSKALVASKEGKPEAELHPPLGYCPTAKQPGAAGRLSWVHCREPIMAPST